MIINNIHIFQEELVFTVFYYLIIFILWNSAEICITLMQRKPHAFTSGSGLLVSAIR